MTPSDVCQVGPARNRCLAHIYPRTTDEHVEEPVVHGCLFTSQVVQGTAEPVALAARGSGG
jgi:hypothetical protein